MKITELAEKVDVHPDTLWKAKRRGSASKKLAPKLEKATGIPEMLWIYPKKYGDPWRLLKSM